MRKSEEMLRKANDTITLQSESEIIFCEPREQDCYNVTMEMMSPNLYASDCSDSAWHLLTQPHSEGNGSTPNTLLLY